MPKTDKSNSMYRWAEGGRRVARAVALTAASLSAAACATYYSETPLAKSFPVTTQQKTQSSSHWRQIANHLTYRLKPAIGNKQVFVAPGPAAEPEFSQVFRRQLQATLLANDVKVIRQNPQRGEHLVLDVSAQLLKFSPDRVQNRGFGGHVVGPGTVHEVAEQWRDSLYAGGTTPEHELVVTVSLSNATHLVAQRTEAYYIADGDRGLYEPLPKTSPQPSLPPSQAIRVSGGR